jgi:hypothetical protein
LEYCSNWSLGVVSTSSHDVVIQAGKAVTVTADAFAKSIVIMSTGILTIKQYYFNRFENVTINSGGFNAGTGNNESATMGFGNFTNQGTANFLEEFRYHRWRFVY